MNEPTNQPTNQRSSKWINANKNERGCLSRSLKSWFLRAVPLNFFKTIWLFGPKCISNTSKSIVSVRCTGASNGPKKNSPAPYFLTDSLMSGYRMKPALLVFDVLHENEFKTVQPSCRTSPQNLVFLYPLLHIQADLFSKIEEDPSVTAIYKWVKVRYLTHM